MGGLPVQVIHIVPFFKNDIVERVLYQTKTSAYTNSDKMQHSYNLFSLTRCLLGHCIDDVEKVFSERSCSNQPTIYVRLFEQFLGILALHGTNVLDTNSLWLYIILHFC